MPREAEHFFVVASELKERLSKVPDDSWVAFVADNIPLQFLGIAPDTRPGVEGVFVINLRAHHNYPPVSP